MTFMPTGVAVGRLDFEVVVVVLGVDGHGWGFPRTVLRKAEII
jgi:hypothetical protein